MAGQINLILKNKLYAGILLAALFLCALGLTAHVSLGDEVHHYRFAKDDYRIGGRASFDSIYGSGEKPGFYYTTEPLWSLGLSWFWHLTGGVFFTAAQIYQTLFYILLLIAASGFAGRRYDCETSLWSAVFLASVPMVATFGMLFYLDVPSAALTMLSLWLLELSQYPAAGLVLAAGIVTKKSSMFFYPAFFLILAWRHRKDPVRGIIRSIFLFLPTLIVMIFDARWKINHLSLNAVNNQRSLWNGIIGMGHEIQSQALSRLFIPLQPSGTGDSVRDKINPLYAAEYAVSNFHNAIDLLKYFGAVICVLLIFYFLFRCFKKKDLILWLCTLSYLTGIFLFHLLPDVRYFLPIAPFLAIFCAKAFISLPKNTWIKSGVVFLCVVQFLAVSFYTRQQRAVAPALQEGFAYIEKNVPKDAVLLYPETNIIEFTDRQMVWSLSPLRAIFWGSNYEKLKALDYAKVGYIVIKKKRVYNDHTAATFHTGAYPQSFIEDLPRMPFLERIFDNSEMSLWKIKWEKINAGQAV